MLYSILGMLILGAVLVAPSSVKAACPLVVNLEWAPNTEDDLAGYSIGYGEVSGVYTSEISLNSTYNYYPIAGMKEGRTYYFAVLAYDTSGNRSEWSKEVSYTVPISDTDAPQVPTSINIPSGSNVVINIGGNQ